MGYNWLVSNNEVINTGADVTFHGGYVVHLTNFSSLGGAKFDAYVKPFSCSSTLASYRMADAPADSTTPVNPTTYTAYLQVLNKTAQDKPFVVSPQNANNIDALVQSANKINSSSLLIIPNPSSTGLFHLDFTSTEKLPVKMNVYNTLGVQVTETTLMDEFAELNISDQPKGVYFVKIFTSNGVITKKLVYQ